MITPHKSGCSLEGPECECSLESKAAWQCSLAELWAQYRRDVRRYGSGSMGAHWARMLVRMRIAEVRS